MRGKKREKHYRISTLNLQKIALILGFFAILAIFAVAQETNQSNTTSSNLTNISTEPVLLPIVDISLNSPQKLTRGESFEVEVNIKNSGSGAAKIVDVNLQLPKGIEIDSRNGECDILDPNSTCTITFSLRSSLSTSLGKNYLKVVVNYEA